MKACQKYLFLSHFHSLSLPFLSLPPPSLSSQKKQKQKLDSGTVTSWFWLLRILQRCILFNPFLCFVLLTYLFFNKDKMVTNQTTVLGTHLA